MPDDASIELAERSELVDRPDLVAALLSDPAPVVLVGGPSGAGKSIVLRKAVDAARAERNVSEVYEVMYADPLATVLIDRLAEIVAGIADSTEMATRIGQRLSGAIERLVASRGRELAHAAGQELLNLVRGQLGPEAGKAVMDAVTALREEAADSLGSRLARARPQVQREVVVELFTEVAALCDGRRLVVPLDRCERLDDGGLRLLADLAEVLPDNCQIWAAVKTDEDEGEFLARTDAAMVLVPPLDLAAIEELLEWRQLLPARAQEVLDQTAGIALDVQAQLGLMAGGAQPAGDQDGDVLARDTEQRLAGLPDAVDRLVLRLAALSDPLPEPRLVALAEGDAEMLARTMGALRDADLLTAHAAGEWFHERRGAAILEVADPDERTAALADAATAVWEHVATGGGDRWLVELAGLAALAADGWERADDAVRAVLELDDGGLAIVAGLIELGQRDNPVDAQQLLQYVRVTYPTDGAELDSLRRVGEAGLAILETADHSALAIIRLTPVAGAVAYGRIARKFGQMPIASIASTAFRFVLEPRIGPWVGQAAYGVGHPSLRALSYMALGRIDDPTRSPTPGARRDAGSALIMRGALAGRPLYGAYRFADKRQRDRALDAITGLDVEFLDTRLTVSTAMAYPIGVVPVNRFRNAASRVVGRNVASAAGRARPADAEPLSFGEFIELRVRTHRTLRNLSGAAERGGLGLDRPLSLHWASGDSGSAIVEVKGGREIACHHDFSPRLWDRGPFNFFQLEDELDLRPGESIVRVNFNVFSAPEHAPWHKDPVLTEIDKRRDSAIAYNQSQPRLPVTVDETLVEPLRAAFLREMADAREFAAQLPFLGRDDWEIPATTRYVVLTRDLNATVWWAEVPSTTERDECHVTFREADHDDEKTVWDILGLDEESVPNWGWSERQAGIAKLLGHNVDDIDA